MKKRLSVLSALGLVALVGCEFPYEPAPQGQPGVKVDNVVRSDTLYALNGGEQICNPSVSQNETYFPGCMMFLNLGVMSVKTNQVTGWRSSAIQHDRICIIDTANEIRWLMLKPSFIAGGGGQMQDPEWSNHNNYATFLGDEGGVPAKVYGYVVRISDKSVFRMHKSLTLSATPFVWLPDTGGDVAPDVNAPTTSAPQNETATFDANNVVSRDAVLSFFGTTNVKFAYASQVGSGLNIFYVDFNEATPQVHPLPRPAGLDANLACESPLISPDGKWVTYQVLNADAPHSAWIQRLDPSSTPIRIGGTADAYTEPHWWKSPFEAGNPLYVTYSTNRQFANPLSLADSAGKEGWTYSRRVNIPSSTSITSMPLDQLLGSQEVLVGLPLQGGRSRSGTYYVTGYMKPYIYKFPAVQL